MDSRLAFIKGETNKDKEPKVFDWVRAAKIIKEKGADSASAGLQSDWEWTGGDILKDGEPIPEKETYVHLTSTWAIPELNIEGEITECYLMESESTWKYGAYWPEEALKILGEEI